jgi:gentisate 1,2-dioxygenase
MSSDGELRHKPMDEGVAETAARAEFYARASDYDLAPLWKVLAGLVTPTPRPKSQPHRWRYAEVRPFLMEACELVTAAEAERRVLILENPALRGQSRVADSLFAGFQIIRPGEVAPAHRHVASALRFIVEGSDAYTAVDGERTIMSPGDFVITPSWVWHDHGAFGDGPMVWLDGLDMHIVNLLNASFREELESARHEIVRTDDSSRAEFGYAMAPADRTRGPKTSPILNYPYVRADEALTSMAGHKRPDPWRGHMLDYLNPLTGDWAMPTIATSMRRLPAGFSTKPYRSTDTTVFCVVEGEGVSRIGDVEFDWAAHDVFVAPSWMLQQHEARRRSTIFSYSDRAVQEKLGMWREERLVS